MGHAASLCCVVCMALWACAGGSVDVAELVKGLTLAQKMAQMTQLDVSMAMTNGTLDEAKLQGLCRGNQVGSFFNCPGDRPLSLDQWRALTSAIDRVCSPEGPRIPIVYAIDSIHGAGYITNATLFPHQINVAATFNTALARQQGRVTARETRAAGIHWVFGPILGIATQPSWARVYETFGEDPFLAAAMGRSYVEGVQGADLRGSSFTCAATMKHFIGYSNSRTGQDRTPVWLPDNVLLQYYLPPFEAAVRAGVATAMEAYTELNGEPVVGSHKYLTRLLRGHLRFAGPLVTDWQEVQHLHHWHRAVASDKLATEAVMRDTSVDMSMVPLDLTFPRDLGQLLREGRVAEARLDRSVARVLRLKADLGLLSGAPATPPLPADRCVFACRAHREAAYQTAVESVTLLENRGGTLPLAAPTRLLLLGFALDSLAAMSGGWTLHWQGADSDEGFAYGQTFVGAMREALPQAQIQFYAALCPDDIGALSPNATAWALHDTTGRASLASDEDQGFAVRVPAPGAHPWDVAVEQRPVALHWGTEYLLEAEVWASRECDVQFKIGPDHAPWSDLLLRTVRAGPGGFVQVRLRYVHRSEECAADCVVQVFVGRSSAADLTVRARRVVLTAVACATAPAVRAAAAAAEVVIAAVGEWPYTERPGDTADLRLQGQQQRLVRAAAGGGAPVVLVLVEGRPRLLEGLVELSAAVLHAFLPGPAGGPALRDLVLGRRAPSGRLPYSYPRTPHNAPLQYWRKPSAGYAVQWPFGAGRGYGRVAYAPPAVTLDADQTVVAVAVAVTNAGAARAQEPVLLYAAKAYRRVTPEVRMLRAFDKVWLAPNETRTVVLRFSTEDLAYVDVDCCRIVEAGDYSVLVGERTAPFALSRTRRLGCSVMCTRRAPDPVPWSAVVQAHGAVLALAAAVCGLVGAGCALGLRRLLCSGQGGGVRRLADEDQELFGPLEEDSGAEEGRGEGGAWAQDPGSDPECAVQQQRLCPEAGRKRRVS